MQSVVSALLLRFPNLRCNKERELKVEIPCREHPCNQSKRADPRPYHLLYMDKQTENRYLGRVKKSRVLGTYHMHIKRATIANLCSVPGGSLYHFPGGSIRLAVLARRWPVALVWPTRVPRTVSSGSSSTSEPSFLAIRRSAVHKSGSNWRKRLNGLEIAACISSPSSFSRKGQAALLFV